MPIPSQRTFDALHLANLDKYSRKVRMSYIKALKEITKLSSSLSLNSNSQFFFRNHSEVNRKVNNVLKSLYFNVYGGTVSGINTEWDLAVNKNNELTRYVYGKDLDQLPKQYRSKYLSNNAVARRNFIFRKDAGLGLSSKVWNNTRQFKQELELALELGIGGGKAATTVAKDVTKYLNDPEMLFRRVRETKGGTLRLSKAAKAYHPGQGRYRSSFRNALRLTRNETNFSYEGSQVEKRKQQDFIVGIRIKVSRGHNPADDKGGVKCIDLQGKYPKNFNWTYKWHVNCICLSLNILKTREELDEDTDKILAGLEPNTPSKNTINGLPNSYNNYLNKNQNMWKNWKNPPRTFKGNENLVIAPDVIKGTIPEQLLGNYGKNISWNEEFFEMLPKSTSITFNNVGSNCSRNGKVVSIAKYKDRWKNSDWYKESIIYHEGGHAIDIGNAISNKYQSDNFAFYELFTKYEKSLLANGAKKAKKTHQELLKYYFTEDFTPTALQKKFGLRNIADIREQVSSTMDALMSLTVDYGAGHSLKYFDNYLNRRLEFFAHMMENKYAGNKVFEKIMPELYKDMITVMDELKIKLK